MSAFADILAALRQPNIWFILGVQDYMRQFGRTILGPVWAIAQPLVFVAAIGFFFAPFMSDDPGRYTVYVAIGFAVFTFISGAINECGSAFLTHKGVIQNFAAPMFVHILREAMRNICRFAAQLLVAALVMVWHRIPLEPIALLAIAGLAVNIAASIFLSLAISMLTVRWGDFKFAVGAVMRLMFFATPILWVINDKKSVRAAVAELNPFTHYIEIIRQPLLGAAPATSRSLKRR